MLTKLESWWNRQDISEAAKRETFRRMHETLFNNMASYASDIRHAPLDLEINQPAPLHIKIISSPQLLDTIRFLETKLRDTAITKPAPEDADFPKRLDRESFSQAVTLPAIPQATPQPPQRPRPGRTHIAQCRLSYTNVGAISITGSFVSPAAAQAVLGPIVKDADNANLTLSDPQKPPMWTLHDALSYLQPLEHRLQLVGYSCALLGSVLHKGESKNGLDLVVLPLSTEVVSLPKLHHTLETFGLSLTVPTHQVHTAWYQKKSSNDSKRVSFWETKDNRRVNIFMLS